MSIFNGNRLTNETFKLDIERMRKGWYSDKYFDNVGHMLDVLGNQDYHLAWKDSSSDSASLFEVMPAQLKVEMQWFTRRRPYALISGVDKALSILFHCTGRLDQDGHFRRSWSELEVEAVQDGVFTRYDGDTMNVQPVLKVRGLYRDFAMLETPTLGILSRASRIATNVYNTLLAAGGKPVLFFPARFDVHEVQAADGYAYDIAVQRFNRDHHYDLKSFVSTDAQGDWWGGFGGGTVPHAVIACFMGSTVDAMLCFAATQDSSIPRIALVDFDNDCVSTSLEVTRAMFERYWQLMKDGNVSNASKFKLFGVRLDTSSNMRDKALDPLGDPTLDLGVNPRLVVAVRRALDNAWSTWDMAGDQEDAAQEFCQGIKIVVSGGFSPEKITRFEALKVPVDIYGVGSSLMVNDTKSNTDFTADITSVFVNDRWVPMSKVGRTSCSNPDLERLPKDFEA